MTAARPRDQPWRRLPFLLPPATLLAYVALAGFLRILMQAPERPPLPHPVDVTLVELPAPVAPPAAETAPQRVPEPEIAPLKEEPPPKAVVKPPPQPKPVPPRQPRSPPRQPTSSVSPPGNQVAPLPAPPPAMPSPQPTPPGGSTTGARAIYQPMPEIPEELRRRRLDAVAVVVFHVNPDGSAAVELRAATDDPRLNQALLDGFKRWRFFPALDHDKPVASMLELRVPVQVR